MNTSTPKVFAASSSKVQQTLDNSTLSTSEHAADYNASKVEVSPEMIDTSHVSGRKITPKTKRIMTLESCLSKCRRKIFNLEKSKQRFVEILRSKLTPVQFTFVMSQLRFFNKDKRGRRWSPEEKAMSLNIFMRNTRTYNYLRQVFAFPSYSTLKRSIGPVAQDTGICPILIRCLKNKIEKMKYEEKLCILMFDEMSMKKSLSYNAALDRIDGMESVNRSEGEPQQATHALVFMIRGLTTCWKQVLFFNIILFL